MAHPQPSTIRNVAVVGHRGSGKTSLVEAMLFAAGAVSRLGSVGEGTTVSDFDEDERRRGMSISASLCHATWKGHKVNLLDTPGESSFLADALSALRAADSALFVVNATMGVEVMTERLWNRARDAGLARAAAVNMLDRERAGYAHAIEMLRELDAGCVAIQIPIGEQHDFRGVVNLVSMTATTYDGTPTGTTGPVPDHMAADAQAARDRLIDQVAENDDALIEKYLEGEEITTDELIAALTQGIAEGRLCPVMCTAGGNGGAGADRLLDLVVEALPSPLAAAPWVGTDGADAAVEVAASEDGPAVAYVFKTLADQFSGKVNLLRVVTGTLPGDTQVTVSRTGGKERVGHLFTLQGKDHVNVQEIGPGDIGAVAKLKDVLTGDVLTTGSRSLAFPAIEYPPAVMSVAVSAKNQGDEDKVMASLRRLREEDPTLDVHRDDETGDLILGGLSQMHVETIVDRMNRRFHVEVELHPPHVPYHETITATAQAEGKHKKQSGGRGQYGDCWLRVEPLERGGGFEFVDAVVGGAIPRTFIPAVEKGVHDAMRSGHFGYPVVDVRVTVYDGKYHPVDSSEIAFKIAGSLGMKAALEKARPVLLEPVMRVEVTVPEELVGDVMGDLNSRRGRPQGMETRGHNQIVRAEVPMAEMLSYAADLRAMTGGRGDYAMEFLRYDEVPSHMADKLAKAEKAA
ncbi:MAG: elongation factor G [Actinomycetota bacterium]